jgi:16S rRNA (guanine(527)-N(7))-methyltransferase RsmG
VKRSRPQASEPAPGAVGSEVATLLESAPELRVMGLPKLFFDRMEQFAASLSVWGARSNLTASPQSAREICFHIVDSLAPLWVARGAVSAPGGGFEKISFLRGFRVADLGTGAGFPGLVLAAATDAEFTLVESRRKRASFLIVAAAEMGLQNVAVRWARAEVTAAEGSFDIVTARAVGESRGTIELAADLLRAGGIAILYVGGGQTLDTARAERAGLALDRETPYSIARGGGRVARALAVLRKRG